jgi:hypothetical protein
LKGIAARAATTLIGFAELAILGIATTHTKSG